MTDNYFKNCPPKMGGFREMTDYRTATLANESIKKINNISRDDNYRYYLQTQGSKLANNEWNYLRDNHSCWTNQCIFNQRRTLIDPSVFTQEMIKNNTLLTQTPTPGYPCKRYPDYRLNK